MVDVFSSRDTDSYILQRELDSVNVWLSSDKPGHIMRGTELIRLFYFMLQVMITLFKTIRNMAPKY